LVAKLTDQAIPDREINEVLAELALTVMAFDEAQGLIAGQLRSLTRPFGLSLGDRACLALGLHTQYPVLTADRDWGQTPQQGARYSVNLMKFAIAFDKQN